MPDGLPVAEEQPVLLDDSAGGTVVLVPVYEVAEAVSGGNISQDTNRGHRNGKPNFPWQKSNLLSNTNLHTSNSFLSADNPDNTGYHTNRCNHESVEVFPEYNIHTTRTAEATKSVVTYGLSPCASGKLPERNDPSSDNPSRLHVQSSCHTHV